MNTKSTSYSKFYLKSSSIDKEDVVHIYNGILLSHQKGRIERDNQGKEQRDKKRDRISIRLCAQHSLMLGLIP